MFLKFLENHFVSFCFCLFLIFQGSLPVAGIVQANETTLIFYYGPKYSDSMRYKLSEATNVLKNPHFKKGKTHMYIHGFRETQDSESIHLMVDSYSKRKNINLITVDWAKAAGDQYIIAAGPNIEILGAALAGAIIDLNKAGLDRKDLTVVAHSLGAQLAGKTGRDVIVQSKNTNKIYKMVLLDAAFPLFFTGPPRSVNKNDAEFVQAIHTDIGTYGTPFQSGHVDFWPNGGRQGQPGCPQGLIIPLSKEDLCSHQRSFRFWAESVANVNNKTRKFLGFPSYTYTQFLLAGRSNLNHKTVEMGIECPMSARGNYYLKTNSQSPFARGIDGY